MNVKIKKDGDSSQRYYHCEHVSVTVNGPGTPAVRLGLASPGIVIELSPGPTLRLPEDGDSVYFINDAGKTIDAHHWPLRDKAAAQHDRDAEVHNNR